MVLGVVKQALVDDGKEGHEVIQDDLAAGILSQSSWLWFELLQEGSAIWFSAYPLALATFGLWAAAGWVVSKSTKI